MAIRERHALLRFRLPIFLLGIILTYEVDASVTSSDITSDDSIVLLRRAHL